MRSGVIALPLLLLFVALPTRGTVLHVPSDYATIQDGLDAASSGDSVIVGPGTYSEAIQLRSGVVLSSSGGPEVTVITYSVGVYALITAYAIGPPAVVTGFTLDGANTIEKGLITDASAIEFTHNVVRNFWGIGLHFDSESRVQDCVVYHCGRAGIYAGAPTGYPTIEDCLLYDCGYAPYIASEAIGGHYGGGFIARRCTVVANHDGLVPGYRASVIEDCIVASNANYGIYVWPDVTVTVTCSDVWGNGTNYHNMTPGPGCISEDPLFCDPENLAYTLDAASPCLAPNNACGMTMGAFGAGCGVVFLGSSGLLADLGHATGVSWLDLDGDRDLDVYALRTQFETDFIYENLGAGEFAPLASSALGDPGNGLGMDWGDYDNDGDLDVYVVNSNGSNRLYRNDGAGAFSDATSGPIDHGAFDAGASWVDFDRDGLLDIFLTTSFQPKRLYRNLGGGAFADVTPPALATTAQSSAAAWGDYDNDGDPDVYLSVVAGPNALFRNDGGGAFANVTTPPLNDAGTGQGVAWGDYDNDGDLDLYLCNFGQPNRLFRSDSGGAFVDVASGALADANQGQSGTWADFDNDRDLDLVLTNFGQPSYVLRNDGGNAFSPVATVGETEQSLGAAWGDYDEDGDEDLFIANYGSADRLYRNDQATGNAWLDIELVGTASNRSGHGARVVLVDLGTGTTQMREHGSNHGFWSVNAPVVHFGLGTASHADALIVRWPSGTQEIFEDVAANQRLTIIEGGGIVGAPVVATAAALAVRTHPNPFRETTGFHLSGPRDTRATVRIFDVQGRLVRSLAGEVPGTVPWDGLSSDGGPVPSGVYFYRALAGSIQRTGKVIRAR